jgi:hypothetical protein
MYVFSAKGAEFTIRLGQRPRIRSTLKNTGAEGAIHFHHQFHPLARLKRAFSAWDIPI